MLIQIDTREKKDVIEGIKQHFGSQGIGYFDEKLEVGDYEDVHNPGVVIDRKHNLNELCSNLSDVPQKKKGTKVFKMNSQNKTITDRERFIREIKRAQELGKKLIFLVEHGQGIKCLEDVRKWKNPRLKESALATSGEMLYKKLLILENEYGVKFYFCSKKDTGREIIRLLKEVSDE
ncbi:MAG: ERCC4 domain-containing protein [Acutalibacteraceae bacterium]|nr:ERCC4 domain-containing protein [Acutalibacteraceae bacterium]